MSSLLFLKINHFNFLFLLFIYARLLDLRSPNSFYFFLAMLDCLNYKGDLLILLRGDHQPVVGIKDLQVTLEFFESQSRETEEVPCLEIFRFRLAR